MDIRCVVYQSLKELDCWLRSPEMAFIGMNGGHEKTVRDRLMYRIQKLMPDTVVRSEGTVARKRADIGIFQYTSNDKKKKKKPLALIELKNNFSFQIGFETEKGNQNQDTGSNSPHKKNAIGDIERDISKWSYLRDQIPLCFIQIVTRIEYICSDLKPTLKYPKEQPEKTEGNLPKIEKYFHDLESKEQGVLTIHQVEAISKSPFELAISTTFFILEIGPPKNDVQEM